MAPPGFHDSGASRSSSQHDSPPKNKIPRPPPTEYEIPIVQHLEQGRTFEELRHDPRFDKYMEDLVQDYIKNKRQFKSHGWTLSFLITWMNLWHCAPPLRSRPEDALRYVRDLVAKRGWDRIVVSRWLRNLRCLPPPPGFWQMKYRSRFPKDVEIAVRSLFSDYADIVTNVTLQDIRIEGDDWNGDFNDVWYKAEDHQFADDAWLPTEPNPEFRLDHDVELDTDNDSEEYQGSLAVTDSDSSGKCQGNLAVNHARHDSFAIMDVYRKQNDAQLAKAWFPSTTICWKAPCRQRGRKHCLGAVNSDPLESAKAVVEQMWKCLGVRFDHHFISSRGNEYFCEIDEEYLTDRFNLTNLNAEVQYYQYALDLVTDVFDLDCEDDMREQIEKSARHLYGLVHARYIVTTRGLAKMLEKYKKGDFGKCPRVMCDSQHLLPTGLSDNPHIKAVKLYCSKCEDLYNPKSSRHASVDGAYFGTSFHNILFQVYPTLVPEKSARRHEPKIFGFKVHAPAALMRWQDMRREELKGRLRRLRIESGFEEDRDLEEEEGEEGDETESYYDEEDVVVADEGVGDGGEGDEVVMMDQERIE